MERRKRLSFVQTLGPECISGQAGPLEPPQLPLLHSLCLWMRLCRTACLVDPSCPWGNRFQ